MQVTVTDNNDWEGESFSFILDITPELAEKIQAQESERMTVEYPTGYDAKSVEEINTKSDNGYMNRIGFYEINPKVKISSKTDFYEDIFYKGTGLKRI